MPKLTKIQIEDRPQKWTKEFGLFGNPGDFGNLLRQRVLKVVRVLSVFRDDDVHLAGDAGKLSGA